MKQKDAFELFYRSDEAQEFIRADLFTCLASDAFAAGAKWAIEECAKVADSYAPSTECRWGEGATFNAIKIATKIRELANSPNGNER